MLGIALIAATMVGCGGDDGSSGDDSGKTADSPNVGASTEKMVTAAEGGEVALAEAGVNLSIPAGALAEDTMISAEVISKSGLKDADEVVGNVVEFGPDGLKFEKPAMLELAVGDAKIPTDATVSLAWYDDENGKWVDLEGSKLEGGKVMAETTHFTVFAIRIVVNDNGQLVQMGGECTDTFKACGGNLEGTWNIVHGCADIGNALGQADSACKGASIAFGIDITGDVVIGGGKISGTLMMSSELTQIMPKSCVGGSCPMSTGSDPDDVVFVDKGDTCEGTSTDSETQEVDETYTVEDNMFVTAGDDNSSDMSEYCVSGDKLVVNTVSEDGITIRWTAMRK
jgi:hypothetical protein